MNLLLSTLPVVTAAAVLLGVPGAQAVVSIQATKTDVLQVDADGSNTVTPGDTVRYTITLTNSGDSDATNSVFNDTIDNNTAFVPGSLQTTPIARNDSNSTVGNVELTVSPAAGVLLNDSDPDGSGGLTVSSFDATSANGGSVSVASTGGFTYNPPAGFSGTDTFTYTVNDGESNTDSATVSITVGQVVWFINNAVGGPGDGRFTSPFSGIANFNSLAADDPGDYIFVYQGSGAYSDALTLLNTQQLIGHGTGLTISPNLSIAAASRPTISNVALASGNTVRGLNVSTASGTGISGGSVGALTVNNVSVTNSAGVSVSLNGGTSSMAVTLDSVSSSGGANGIVLTNNSGSFTSNGGTIDPTTGHGIQVSNTGVGPLNFTLTNSTVTGAPAGFNGINFEIPTSGSFGTVNVTSNTISNNGSTGLRAVIQGTGSISKIDVGSNTFTGNDIGVDLVTNGTASVDFDIHNNPTMNGTRTQVNIAANDVVHNNGSGPTMRGYVRNNTLTTSPTGSAFIALWVVSDGDGNITVDINNNTITNFGDSGIDVESRGGTGDVNARIANNSATTTATAALAGMFLRSGNGLAGETSLLCVNMSSNNMNGGAGAVADYYLDRFNPATTLFQIQGLSPAPATPAQAEAFVVSTDSAPPATAFAETGTYTAATCATLPFALVRSKTLSRNATSDVDSDGVVPGSTQPLPDSDGAVPAGQASNVMLAPITPVNLGTLNPNQQVTITFDVTINSAFTGTSVSNQGNLTADGGVTVLTDDPDVVCPANPTVTDVQQSDTDPPDVTIDQASGQADPTSASPINFTAMFNEPVSGFGDSSGDVNLSGSAGATTAVVTESAPNDGTTYDVAVSGMTSSGTVIASIPANKAIDVAGNGNTASTSVDNEVTFISNVAPTITVAPGGQCANSGGTMNLSLNDPDGEPLTISATSSNTSLVPNGNIVFAGSGANRTVSITARSLTTIASATITIIASDGSSSAQTTITVVVGTNASETLPGTAGADLIIGRNGNDTMNALAGNDLLCSGRGIGTLNGGDGHDTLEGERGNDFLRGDAGNDILRGQQGNDTLTGGADADNFSGGAGTDTNTDFNAGQGDTSDGS